MSREKKHKPRRPRSTAWAALDGAVLGGGCAHCHAEIHVYVDTDHYSAKQVQIRHDDDCPELALRQRTGATETLVLAPPKGMSTEEFVDHLVETCGPEVLPMIQTYSGDEIPAHLRGVAALSRQTNVA